MTPPRPLRWQFLTLFVGLLVPTLLFVGVLLWRFAASERTRVEQDVQTRAHGLSVAFDREIHGVLTTLQALATSPSLAAHDLPAFPPFSDGQGGYRASDFHHCLPAGATITPSTKPKIVTKILGSRG